MRSSRLSQLTARACIFLSGEHNQANTAQKERRLKERIRDTDRKTERSRRKEGRWTKDKKEEKRKKKGYGETDGKKARHQRKKGPTTRVTKAPIKYTAFVFPVLICLAYDYDE